MDPTSLISSYTEDRGTDPSSLCQEREVHIMHQIVGSVELLEQVSHSPLLVLDSHSRCLDEAVENNEANNNQND